MTQPTLSTRQSERGFTLVELAIVMIIIGLLIGGVLKGQELISNARITSTVSQIKAVEAGVNTFRDKYGGLPGDLRNAATALPNCTGYCDPTVGTNGNGQIETAAAANGVLSMNPGAQPTANSESVATFPQLAAAGIVTGAASNAAQLLPNESNPELPIGGSWVMASTSGVPTGGNSSVTGLVDGANKTLTPGVYIMSTSNLNAAVSTTANSVHAMTAVQAGAIDRKIDDGLPNAGTTQAAGATSAAKNGNVAAVSGCAAANTNNAGVVTQAPYNQNLKGNGCDILVGIQ